MFEMKHDDIERELRKISEKTDIIRYNFEPSNVGLRGARGLIGTGGPAHDTNKECLSEIDLIINDLQDIKRYLKGESKLRPKTDLNGYVQCMCDGKVVIGLM